MRVVLVGGGRVLDGLTRSDGVDLVRARTPLEAVGELACPPESMIHAPTVVLVSPDADLNGSLDAFLSAIRVVDPDVRIARVDQTDACTVTKGGFDAVFGPGVSVGAVRRLVDPGFDESVSGVGSGQVKNPRDCAPTGDAEFKPVAETAPASRSALPGRLEVFVPIDGDDLVRDGLLGAIEDGPGTRSSAAETVGDGAMLRELRGSREALIRAGLRLIKSRMNSGDVVFIDNADPDTETQPVPSVPVTSGGKRYGALRVSGVSAEALVPHASWLGSWLGLRERQQVLRKSAFTDPLTGAWNRRYFDGFLQAALDRARETRRTVTVLIFDIDEFKKYNDNYGHPAGDEILIETVRALKESVRPSDRVCRIGGDEFAVIFDEPEGPRQAGSRPPESVYVLAKRVQKKIGESEFPKLGADAAGKLTISGGLAAFPWDGHDLETLLQKADDLACESKRAGKNAITLGPGAERVCRHAGDDLIG